MPAVASTQLTLDFEPGLAERYKSLLECCRDSIYKDPRQLKAIAADMDLSSSELSRKLSENAEDTRRYTVEDLENRCKQGDLTPIYYLVEKFLTSEETKNRRALAELVKKLPDIVALAEYLSSQGIRQ